MNDEIRDDVMKIKKALGLEKDFDDMRELETKQDTTPSEGGDRACGTDDKKRAVEEAEKAAAEERAFEAYIRGKAMNSRDTDVNLTPANNGAVIPTTIANKIIKKVYNICPILEKSSKYNIKGNLDIPFYPASDESLITVAYHDEFEELVRNYKRGYKFTTNVGVGDANGGAAFFEIWGEAYRRYDVDKTERGFDIRSSFSFAGDMERLGYSNTISGYYYPIVRAMIAKTIDSKGMWGELDRASK